MRYHGGQKYCFFIENIISKCPSGLDNDFTTDAVKFKISDESVYHLLLIFAHHKYHTYIFSCIFFQILRKNIYSYNYWVAIYMLSFVRIAYKGTISNWNWIVLLCQFSWFSLEHFSRCNTAMMWILTCWHHPLIKILLPQKAKTHLLSKNLISYLPG